MAYISVNRKGKMELIAKDHAQQGPHKSFTGKSEVCRRNSSPLMAQAYASLRNNVMWPERVTGMINVPGP